MRSLLLQLKRQLRSPHPLLPAVVPAKTTSAITASLTDRRPSHQPLSFKLFPGGGTETQKNANKTAFACAALPDHAEKDELEQRGPEQALRPSPVNTCSSTRQH